MAKLLDVYVCQAEKDCSPCYITYHWQDGGKDEEKREGDCPSRVEKK